MQEFVLSIDQGTTGTTALLIDVKTAQLVDKVNQEFTQVYPKPGWVEHNLQDIWKSVGHTISHVLQKNNVSGKQIRSIGITNQRETTCAFNKLGEPLANAIVWQDRRTSNYCDSKNISYQSLKNKTGLPLDPYFSGTKMNWLLANNDNVKRAADNSDLRLATIDSYLVYKLTGGDSFVTEASNASRTLLMDLDHCQWDSELLDFFDVDKSFLPEIRESFTEFGQTKGLDFLPDGIPINCILGDQQAALFGQAGYAQGALKCTYGTGAFILLNTGETKTYSQNGLLTTVAYKVNGKPIYALEGSCYIAGAAVQWLRDNLKIIESSPEVEALAKQVTNLGELEHLMFLPYFTGIGSPHWKAEAKGAILGLTRDTQRKHLAYACLEGMALSVNESIKALVQDSPNPVKEINVDGGASQNNLLMQMQANFSELNIIRPQIIETTAYGVALGALVGSGDLKFEDINALWKKDKQFDYQANESYYKNKKKKWDELLKKVYF